MGKEGMGRSGKRLRKVEGKRMHRDGVVGRAEKGSRKGRSATGRKRKRQGRVRRGRCAKRRYERGRKGN